MILPETRNLVYLDSQEFRKTGVGFLTCKETIFQAMFRAGSFFVFYTNNVLSNSAPMQWK